MNNIPISREYLFYDSRLLQMTTIAPTIKTADPPPRTTIKSPVDNPEESPSSRDRVSPAAFHASAIAMRCPEITSSSSENSLIDASKSQVESNLSAIPKKESEGGERVVSPLP